MSGLSYSDLLQGVSSLEHSISRVRFGIGEFLGVPQKGDVKLRKSLEVLLASELFRPTLTLLLTSILDDLQSLASEKEEEREESDLRDFMISPEHDAQEDPLDLEDKEASKPVPIPNKSPFVAMYLRNECHNEKNENECIKRPRRKTKPTPKLELLENNIDSDINNDFTPEDDEFDVVKEEPLSCSETGSSDSEDNLELKKSPKKRSKIKTTSTTTVSCVECNLQFKTRTRLLFHQREAHRRREARKKRTIHCLICEQPFESWVATMTHWKSHFGPDETKFICPKCPGKEFARIKGHMEIFHSSEECTPKSCPYCQKLFDTDRRYKDHLRYCKVHKKKKNRSEQCEVCQKVLSSKFALLSHMNIHTGAKPYKCTEPGCNQAFKHNGTLHAHIFRWHTQRERFLCTQCPSTFTYSFSLATHMKEIHGPPVTILCSMCPVIFKNEWNLRRHVERVHLDLRPYPCTWEGCGTAFKDKAHLAYHVNNTHLKEPGRRRGINKPRPFIERKKKPKDNQEIN